MNTRNKFIKVYCTELTQKGEPCRHYLGDFQIDVPHSTRFYCRGCYNGPSLPKGKLFEYSIDELGIMEKEIITKSMHRKYEKSIAIAENANV